MSKLTEDQKEYLLEETKIHIMGWLNDPEICEDMIYFNKEVKEITDQIEKKVEKWNKFTEKFLTENLEPDNSDHQFETENKR